jgi:hypothetical protein
MVAAYVYELLLDLFGIIEPFEAALVAHAEDDSAAPGIGHRHYLAHHLFDVYQPYLEFKVSIFSAANEVEQIGPIECARVAARQPLFE